MTGPQVREVPYRRAPLGQRAKPGLVLSIGVLPEGANHPTKLDYFRAKPGPYADKFHAAFGDAPREVPIAIPDDLPHVLDIRWKAYAGGAAGKRDGGYLRALGQTNYVDRAIGGDVDAMNAAETLTVWKPDGTKGEVEIAGPDDPLVARVGLKVYTTFRFWVPDVLGVGSWAEIATTSEVSTHNLFRVLRDQWRAFSGRWVGLPLILYLQESRARPVVNGKRITSKFWALAVRTPLTVSEFVEQRAALAPIQTRAALPPVAHDDTDRDGELSEALWGEHPVAAQMRQQAADLPTPGDEPLRTREEASVVDLPDDALLNRIASLRGDVGADAADQLLYGAFGKRDVAQLDAATAAAYAEGLARLRRDDVDEQPLEGEVV